MRTPSRRSGVTEAPSFRPPRALMARRDLSFAMRLIAVVLVLCGPGFIVSAALTATAPRGTVRPSVRARTCVPLLKASPPEDDASLATKGVWYATEAFGKAAKLLRGAPPVEPYEVGPPPASTAEAIARLVVDYEGTEEDTAVLSDGKDGRGAVRRRLRVRRPIRLLPRPAALQGEPREPRRRPRHRLS